MKPITLIFLAAILSGCTTTSTDEDGNTHTTRFDAAGAVEVVKAGLDTYDRIERYQHPVYPTVIYPQ